MRCGRGLPCHTAETVAVSRPLPDRYPAAVDLNAGRRSAGRKQIGKQAAVIALDPAGTVDRQPALRVK